MALLSVEVPSSLWNFTIFIQRWTLSEEPQTNCYKHVRKGVDLPLPMEILSDILSRLPIESILTCQTVCKAWNRIIQNPIFINKLQFPFSANPTHSQTASRESHSW